MFTEFFLFELKYRLKRPIIYIFTLINFLLVFVATFSDNVHIGGSTDAVHINSPLVIMNTVLLMTLIGIFMSTAIMNSSILKDFEHDFDGIVFSTPLSKVGYLGGRFLAATLISLIPFIGIFAGIYFGSMMPSVDESQIGPFYPGAYWSTFIIGVVPNTFFISAIVFMLAALFRSALFSFIGSMAVLIGYLVMINLGGDLENESVAILMDPLAINSHTLLTKYWTIDEKNSQWLSFSGPILLNRMIWILVAMLMIIFTYFRFSFSKKKSFFKRIKSKNNLVEKEIMPMISSTKTLPKVNIIENTQTTLKQFLHQTMMEFWSITKSTPFIVLLIFGLINMITAIQFVDENYGTGNHPVTYYMVDAIRGSLYLFLVGILMYYSGVVIWRERDYKMSEFFDASPFATWIPFISKMTALIGMLFLILILSILCGVAAQALNGYYNFELGVYARELLVYDLMAFVPLILLAMLLQTLVNNKYLGYFVFIVCLVIIAFGGLALKIKSNLFLFGETPPYIYSDMNKWSLYSRGLAWFNAYWMFFTALLSIGGILFWVRGKSLTWANRFAIAKERFSGKIVFATIGFGLLWLITGSFLFYQTKIVNEIVSDKTNEMRQVNYEVKYKKYQHIAQPRITDVDYEVSIFPKERDFEAKANIKIKNKTSENIDSIHFSMPTDIKVEIKIPNAQLVFEDKELKYAIYQLDKPLLPGDTMNFEVNSSYITKGIENEVSNTDIVENGTFLSSFKLIPVIGYTASGELTDKKKREKNNLPYRPRIAKLHENCGEACRNTYISSDADWVNVSSKISTSEDQIAIAPGTLMKEWKEGGRNFYQYKLKKPVLNFYNFISGRYQVERDIWTSPTGQKVDVEVYYHKGHEYNVDKMMKSLKKSLTYYSKNFMEYPHEQARIIEFPRYATFAQAFPGTMPYSESIGFIANLNEEDAIDMVYYVVAHEMAHQWWAHLVIGAEVQGATMLSETFSQYGALMVMKEEYGNDKMKQFMKYEMDRYLRGRGTEREKEMPLMLNENQQYIHYRKGSVVMYALQDYIGEDSLNMALKRYVDEVAYQEPPYTTTYDVLKYIEQVTPDSLQYLVDDMFKKIVLYSNSTSEASFTKLTENQYEVQINVKIEKYEADSLGKEILVPHNDYIDVGVFSKEKEKDHQYGRPILLERHKISATDTTFTFIVSELPYEAGIDPNFLLVDRLPADNVKKLTEKK